MTSLWEKTISGEPFVPMNPEDGLFRLMHGSLKADWGIPYERPGVPVLLMTGRHDRVFRIAADVAELSAGISSIRETVYLDAGHLFPGERLAAFTREIIAFTQYN